MAEQHVEMEEEEIFQDLYNRIETLEQAYEELLGFSYSLHRRLEVYEGMPTVTEVVKPTVTDGIQVSTVHTAVPQSIRVPK